MFSMLNPIAHTRTDREVMIYTGEPYAIAADVYTAAPNEGHAGWTWYTGASGWLYQAGIEWILGIRRHNQKLIIDPIIPREWPGFTVNYRFGSSQYTITVKNEGNRESSLSINGEKKIFLMDEKPFIELHDDGKEHEVEVIL
nr:hypothetical protein [Bacillus sp. T3]